MHRTWILTVLGLLLAVSVTGEAMAAGGKVTMTVGVTKNADGSWTAYPPDSVYTCAWSTGTSAVNTEFVAELSSNISDEDEVYLVFTCMKIADASGGNEQALNQDELNRVLGVDGWKWTSYGTYRGYRLHPADDAGPFALQAQVSQTYAGQQKEATLKFDVWVIPPVDCDSSSAAGEERRPDLNGTLIIGP